MRFKPVVEWKKRGNGYVANVDFGMKLTVREESGNWIWEFGNLSSVFDRGKSDNKRTAKENAEYIFQRYFRYLMENMH